MIARPANGPECGALRVNMALEVTDTAPILLVWAVKMIVTPVPFVLSQVEHLRTARD
jgi:hypothetical protein